MIACNTGFPAAQLTWYGNLYIDDGLAQLSNLFCYQVLNCLKSQDPLFLMNVVDLLPKLSNTAVGIQHIFQSGRFLVNMLLLYSLATDKSLFIAIGTLRLLLMMTQGTRISFGYRFPVHC